MPQARTSLTHPLRIDAVPAPGGGRIGMTFCPGKVQPRGYTGAWSRDLPLDLDAIRGWGAAAVVTLVEAWELGRYGVPSLGAEVQARGMEWHHLPIVDGDAPRAPFAAAWPEAGPVLRAHLLAGRGIVLHCLGGLGRTGTVAALLLAELGEAPQDAIAAIRQARPGALETEAQVAYALAVQPLPASPLALAFPADADAPAAVRSQPAPPGIEPPGPATLAPPPNAALPALPRAATPDVRDRARGALLGLAAGDALGTTLEFRARDTFPPHAEITGDGPFHLRPGQWTDDTSMALALADSLLAHPGFDPDDLMRRFLSWWRDGEYSCTGRCFDIGSQTGEALARYARDGNPYAGSTDAEDAGNGSLMRLAPAALRHLHDPAAARRLAVDQSRTTHGGAQATECCALFADMLREAVLGRPKAEVLAPRSWSGHPKVQAVAAGAWRGLPRGLIQSTGYVIHTLEAALWALDGTDSFSEATVLAVNLGDDADTVGAVTGQLAGALYGMAGMPQRWLDLLAWQDRLRDAADALAALA